MEQRKELFLREQKWGLNAYLYAPKDDYKHRMYWRDLYTPQEAGDLQKLITCAKECGVEFIYAISPGLDITFSNPKEVEALKNKINQVWTFGCRSFAVLFDDIDPELCPADKDMFSSLASAQVHLTNEVYGHIRTPETFLFCPTDYCAVFCTPNVAQSSYLHTVGNDLRREIDVLWTGPKVVSQEISVESIDEVAAVLKRPPVIWDNLHANDYDPQRMMLGPFKGRPVELIPKLRGILTNPNCEFELNFVAIHTLATWCRSNSCHGSPIKASREGQIKDYIPQEALSGALSDWLVEFSVDVPSGGEQTKRDSSNKTHPPSPRERPLFTAEPLTVADLRLLSDLFYLPYEHGPTALHMIQELHWLSSNPPAHHAHTVSDKTTSKDSEWWSRSQQFDEMCESVVQMFNRLSNVSNRRILYDLYDYICDIKSGVSMARDAVKAIAGQAPLYVRVTDDPEPWGFRGGLSGELQRMLPYHGIKDVFHKSRMTPVYVIRPFTPSDQSDVQQIFRDSTGCLPATEGALLLGDRLACGQLSANPTCAFVVENSRGAVCGYALGVTDLKSTAYKDQYPESLLADNSSVFTMGMTPDIPDTLARRLVNCLVSALRATGCTTFFSELRQHQKRMLDVLDRVGFSRVTSVEGLPNGVIIMKMKA